MGTIKVVLSCLLGLVIVLALTWIIQGNEFFMYKFFAPKQEAVRRDVFEQSKAYNQGMIQDVEGFMVAYNKTTDKDAKIALADVILHRVADYGDEKLPTHLQQFIERLRQEKNNPYVNQPETKKGK